VFRDNVKPDFCSAFGQKLHLFAVQGKLLRLLLLLMVVVVVAMGPWCPYCQHRPTGATGSWLPLWCAVLGCMQGTHIAPHPAAAAPLQ